MNKKTIWMTVLLMVLMGMAGCDNVSSIGEPPAESPAESLAESPAKTEQIPNDPIGVVMAFFDAYTNKDENRMIALSTAETQKEIKDADFVNKGMSGLTYYKVESVRVIMDEKSIDLLKIDCNYDDKTYGEAEKAGIQCKSIVKVVRENGVWQFDGFSSLP